MKLKVTTSLSAAQQAGEWMWSAGFDQSSSLEHGYSLILAEWLSVESPSDFNGGMQNWSRYQVWV